MLVALLDLLLEAVVEVVADLLDQLVVVERAQVELATVLAHRHLSPPADPDAAST